MRAGRGGLHGIAGFATAAALIFGVIMTAARFDFAGIGNAIVDVVAQASEGQIAHLGCRKGAMTLVDADRALELYAAMAPGVETSGGSVANSCAVGSILGARTAFMGKVADDQLGRVFRHDINAAGVHFPSQPLDASQAPTARCLIMVTPDGQRTMNTCLGACVAFSRADLDESVLADAAVTYLEGYLFDPPEAQAAFYHAAGLARAAGRRVALSLSDAFCVARHRAAFLELVRGSVDILFANEAEICSLYQTGDLFAAAAMARDEAGIAVITRGAEGSLVLMDDVAAEIPAEPALVVDTTGAGDAYAAGFLGGITRGLDAAAAAVLGSKAAARVIGYYGARPVGALEDLQGTLARG